jgi:hypothetical protein
VVEIEAGRMIDLMRVRREETIPIERSSGEKMTTTAIGTEIAIGRELVVIAMILHGEEGQDAMGTEGGRMRAAMETQKGAGMGPMAARGMSLDGCPAENLKSFRVSTNN